MLLRSGSVTTAKVAKALAISQETVRRDFEKLEVDGQLSRRHGGAVRLDDSHRDLSLNSREIANVAEKTIIAELALKQIQTGDTIFFDASSTVFYLACLLPNLEVTIVTSALKVAVELARRPAIQVILVGGSVDHGSLSCQGALADSVLERCHVQKAFLSCRGLDAERGLSEANLEQAGLKQKTMNLADETVLLADHTKIGVKSSYFFAKLEDVDALITDRKPGNTVKQALQKGGAKLILPEEK
jgi:DeoR family fructose operon transcriptional repressor